MFSKWSLKASRTFISISFNQVQLKPLLSPQPMTASIRSYRLMTLASSINSIKHLMTWCETTIGIRILINEKRRIRIKLLNLKNSSLKLGLLWKKLLKRIKLCSSSIIEALRRRKMPSSVNRLWSSLQISCICFQMPMELQQKFTKWQASICLRAVHSVKLR